MSTAAAFRAPPLHLSRTPMPYATRSDMITSFGERQLVELTDRAEPPAGLIDDQVLTDALDYADSIIDGYLRERYLLPLTASHPMLKGIAQDIAWWRLYREPTEEVRKRYEGTIATLKQISGGMIRLPDETGGEPAGREGVVAIESQQRLFSRDRMRGY